MTIKILGLWLLMMGCETILRRFSLYFSSGTCWLAHGTSRTASLAPRRTNCDAVRLGALLSGVMGEHRGLQSTRSSGQSPRQARRFAARTLDRECWCNR